MSFMLQTVKCHRFSYTTYPYPLLYVCMWYCDIGLWIDSFSRISQLIRFVWHCCCAFDIYLFVIWCLMLCAKIRNAINETKKNTLKNVINRTIDQYEWNEYTWIWTEKFKKKSRSKPISGIRNKQSRVCILNTKKVNRSVAKTILSQLTVWICVMFCLLKQNSQFVWKWHLKIVIPSV